MPHTPKGTVSKREKHAAIKLLAATVDDPDAPLYLKVQSARSLLQVKPEAKPEPDDDDFPHGAPAQIIETIDGQEYIRIKGCDRDVVLPANGRKFIREDRDRQRLEYLAELPIADGDEAEPLPPPAPRKPTGKEVLRRLRAKRRATREAPAIWS